MSRDSRCVAAVLAKIAMLAVPAVLLTGCARDPAAQIDAATDSAVTTAVRSLPGVNEATVTETKGPPDAVAIALTTAFDPTSPDDAGSATALLQEAARMVYATRHDTVDSVAVTVYGTTPQSTTAVMARSRFARTP